MLNFPLAGAMAPATSDLPKRKRDWRASLFDRLMPDGELEDQDKQAAMRQGLLGLASGLLGTGGGFGNALSAGIQQGLLATNQSVDSQQDRAYKKQIMAQGAGVPSEFRAVDMVARAAGHEPGSEGYKQFMRVHGGVEGRQSSAGFQKVEVVDENGNPRLGTLNGRTGQIDFPDGTSFNPQSGVTQPTMQQGFGTPPLGADQLPAMEADAIWQQMLQRESGGQQMGPDGQPLTSPKGAVGIAQVMPATAPEAAQLAGLPWDENRYRTDPQYNEAIGRAYFDKQLETFADPRLAAAAYNAGPGAVRNALMRANNDPERALSMLPAETRAYVPAVTGGQAGLGNPFVGRRKEDEAAAVKGAEIDTELGRGSAITQMEADRARAVEEAKLTAQREGDKAAALPKRRLAVQQATNKAENLNRALDQAIPNVSVWTAGTVGTPLSKLGGSAAADLRSSLDTIESIVAFDELQQMRASSPTGGALGSVTERELALLGSTITSIKQSQSPEQLRENLTYLKQQYNKVVQQMQADLEADSKLGGGESAAAGDPLGIL